MPSFMFDACIPMGNIFSNIQWNISIEPFMVSLVSPYRPRFIPRKSPKPLVSTFSHIFLVKFKFSYILISEIPNLPIFSHMSKRVLSQWNPPFETVPQKKSLPRRLEALSAQASAKLRLCRGEWYPACGWHIRGALMRMELWNITMLLMGKSTINHHF